MAMLIEVATIAPFTGHLAMSAHLAPAGNQWYARLCKENEGDTRPGTPSVPIPDYDSSKSPLPGTGTPLSAEGKLRARPLAHPRDHRLS